MQSIRYKSKTTPYENFIDSMACQETKITYTRHLKQYLKFSELDDYDQLLELDDNDTFNLLRDFVNYYRKKRNASASYLSSILNGIKAFYAINGKQLLFWKEIDKLKGKVVRVVDDRIYTNSELRLLLEHSDIRIRTAILTLLTTGMRVGALAELRLKDITYLEDYKIYKFTPYSEDISERYTTFCTPECASTIHLYLDFRKNQYENLTGDSPYIAASSTRKKSIESFITSRSLQRALERERYKAGVFSQESTNEIGKIRKPVPRAHGFRKMFNTICIESDMKNAVKEMLMGHKQNLGLDIHYYRPTEQQLLTEYLKVVDNLTINEENRLSKQVQELKQKDDYQQYLIDKKIDEKDEEIAELKKKFAKYEETEIIMNNLLKKVEEWEKEYESSNRN